MSEANFTDQDFLDLRDGLLAEIGRRLRDPESRQSLTSSQLVSAARELAKLASTPVSTAGGAEEENIDFFELVERLPAQRAREHLLAEEVRLQDRLTRVRVMLGKEQ